MLKRNKPLRRTPLKRVSKKRKADMATYSRLRKEFLAQWPVCFVWWRENMAHLMSYDVLCISVVRGARNPCPATDVHHAKKRGKHYLDVSSWLALSRENHQRIHDNPSWARANGLLA
jgi:hypothetical protein